MSDSRVTYRTAFEPAISWSSIAAGALVALAVSVFLTILAAGFGYDLAAGGLPTRASLAAFTPEIGAGAVAIQVLSAGLGGYVTGRLRHVWVGAHSDEAHFRDTAHGLLTWAVATLAGVVLAATVIAPYGEQLAAASPSAPADPARLSQILVQSMFFIAVGMILSAFTAAVAARVGGLQNEHMHLKAGSATPT
jgi:hypothetical protein